MKKKVILFSLFYLMSTTCFAGIIIHGETMDSIILGTPKEIFYIPKILCFGDSITRGTDSTSDFGYRDALQDSLGIGVYDFVGSYQNPEGSTTYDVDHSGVAGQETSEMENRLWAELKAVMPKWTLSSIQINKNVYNNLEVAPSGSIILIHAGTNDISASFTTSDIVDNVEDIVDMIEAFDSNIDVYVALIIPKINSSLDIATTTYNTALNTMLETYQESKSNLHIVDMNSLFKDHSEWESDYMDNIDSHPNDTGYQVMATQWASCISSSLNTNCDGN